MDAEVRIFMTKKEKTIAQGGWGVHMFGHVIGQEWTAGPLRLVAQRRLSISPLKLLPAAGEIELLPTTCKREERKIVLWWDNISACSTANTGSTHSTAMGFVRGMLAHTCEKHDLTVHLWYIPSKDNVIADEIIRRKWYEAEKRVPELGCKFQKSHHTMMKYR